MDGSVLGITQIVDHGSPAQRYNLVLVAEGYQASQMAQFANDAQSLVDYLYATPPYDEPALRCAFNVYRIDVTSTDSGADDPAACGGTGAVARTYFDASFCTSGIQRLMSVNSGTVLSVVNTLMPQWHRILVVVNSPIYGGAGGTPAITSTTPGWLEVAMHEMGHAIYGFADEYPYWAACNEGGHNNFVGAEPANANVTTVTDRATIKWGSLILPSTPMPTGPNLDCNQCDDTINPLFADAVGTFEGADYYHCGIYRPQANCKMRQLNQPFCEVCKQTIRQTLQPYVGICLKVNIKQEVDVLYEKRFFEVPDPERGYQGDPPDWLIRVMAESIDQLSARVSQLGEAFIRLEERIAASSQIAGRQARPRRGLLNAIARLLGFGRGGAG
jgi:hypothetical protein